MGEIDRVRARYEAGVLAYFVRRTGSAELAWDLADETWATAEVITRRSCRPPGDPGAWLFAIARATLCDSLHRSRVRDSSRRKLGTGPAELSPVGQDFIRDAANGAALAELVAGLAPAMREAVLAPVTPRDAAALAERLRPSVPARRERPRGRVELRAFRRLGAGLN
jgi:RNA polymerase sigma-70 factor (ECF subfamily)